MYHVSTLWGVVVAQHQRNALVCQQLTSSSVEHWVPRVEQTIIRHGRRVRSAQPILGRYILFAVDEAWRRVTYLRGVAGVMLRSETQTPAIVERCEVVRLRELCGRKDAPRVVKTLVYGDRVMPKDGPLAWRVGRFDGATKRGEVAVFNLFGREQHITFKAGELLAA